MFDVKAMLAFTHTKLYFYITINFYVILDPNLIYTSLSGALTS